MIERARQSSQIKLPQLEISQSTRNNLDMPITVPVSAGDAQFISFRTISEQNPHFQFAREQTESSILNQSVVQELTQKKKVKEILDQTIYKFRSDHQEEQQTLQRKSMDLLKMQRKIKCYPMRINAISNFIIQSPSNAKVKKVVFSAFTNGAYWYKTESNWLPAVRECSMAAVYNKSVYIFGGIGSEVLGDMLEYDLLTNKFKELKQRGDIPQPRYGHCLHGITYPMGVTLQFQIDNFTSTPLTGRYLILFGGELQFNSQLKLRENLNDVRLFNIDNAQWIALKPNLENIPEPRRSFGSCIVGKGLLIQGGIKSRFQVQNDVHYLNLSLCKWQPIETIHNPYGKGIAFQQMICVYQRPSSMFDKKEIRQKPIKVNEYEGIYCFGGCSVNIDKTTSYYQFFLGILKLDTVPYQWIVPEVTGIAPKSRIQHSATYLNESNLVIIFGGRDDQNRNPYFNDIFAFKIQEREWMSLDIKGDIPQPRASHIAFGYKTQLLIMGGVNLQGYQYQGIQIAEFNQTEIRALIQSFKQPEILSNQQTTTTTTKNTNTNRKSTMKSNIVLPSTSINPPIRSDRSNRRIEELRQLSFQNFRRYMP